MKGIYHIILVCFFANTFPQTTILKERSVPQIVKREFSERSQLVVVYETEGKSFGKALDVPQAPLREEKRHAPLVTERMYSADGTMLERDAQHNKQSDQLTGIPYLEQIQCLNNI